MGKWTEAALKKAEAIRKTHAIMTDAQAYDCRDALMPWRAGCEYTAGERFSHGGGFYRVLQAHTSQAEWLPPDAPSLYVKIADPAEEWPEWVQPAGATDAYEKGAKVSCDGKHWVSTADANVWRPGVYGWEEAEA